MKLYPMPVMITVPVAAHLLSIPKATLYQRVARHADGLGGTKSAGTPMVRLAAVLELAGMTPAQFIAWQNQAAEGVA